MEDQFPVHEAILFGLSGWTEEHVGFWGLVGEDGCCGAVGEATR